MDATTQFEDISHSSKADAFMKDMHIGDLVLPDDGANSKGGILGNEAESSGSDDLMSRALLALAFIAIIYFLYTSVA